MCIRDRISREEDQDKSIDTNKCTDIKRGKSVHYIGPPLVNRKGNEKKTERCRDSS